jgi:hypothetical protein
VREAAKCIVVQQKREKLKYDSDNKKDDQDMMLLRRVIKGD